MWLGSAGRPTWSARKAAADVVGPAPGSNDVPVETLLLYRAPQAAGLERAAGEAAAEAARLEGALAASQAALQAEAARQRMASLEGKVRRGHYPNPNPGAMAGPGWPWLHAAAMQGLGCGCAAMGMD